MMSVLDAVVLGLLFGYVVVKHFFVANSACNTRIIAIFANDFVYIAVL